MHRFALGSAILVLTATLAACSGGTASEPMSRASPTETPPPPAATSTEPPAASSSTAPTATAIADALLAVELIDVRSGEAFTLGELAATSGPVLLEPMAVWCTNCRAQQHEVVEAHMMGDFASVSLDVDLSESADDLAAYADREGFDWHFAMADADLYRQLQERFGVAVTNPPSTPLIIIEADGSVRPLEFGRGTRGAEELVAELGGG